MKKLLIMIVILISNFVFSQNVVFQDNFDNLNNWTLYGNPSPQWVSSSQGRSGLFDNNGDPNYNSGAIGKQTFNISSGFVIESDVYLSFTDLSGCWNGAAIGLANPTYQSWGGYDPTLYFTLFSNGDACWGSNSSSRRHALLMCQYPIDSGNGWENFGYPDPNVSNPQIYIADQYANGWHTLKIAVDPNRMPKFYIDNTLVYSGIHRLSNNVDLQNSALWLGERSSGSAGKSYHDNIKLNAYYSVTTAVEEKLNIIPDGFSLSQNYPNPFNPTTKIRFSIPNSSVVTLKIYDMLGKEVATLLNEEKAPGVYEVNVNTRYLSSGIYFYSIQAGQFSQTKKLMLLK